MQREFVKSVQKKVIELTRSKSSVQKLHTTSSIHTQSTKFMHTPAKHFSKNQKIHGVILP